MTSIGPDAFGGSLTLTGALTAPSKVVQTGNDGHEISNNGSVVYFKYAQKLSLASFTTTAGSANVTLTCSSATGLNSSASDGDVITISNFSATSTDGLDTSDFEGNVTINTSGSPSANQLQFTASSNATTGGTFTASGAIVVTTYKYLDLFGPGVTWQKARHTAPTGSHAN